MMDLLDQDSVGTVGILVGEALDRLVEAHPRHLDKRAAQYQLQPPTFAQEDGRLKFSFAVPASRGSATSDVDIEIRPADDPDGDGINLEALQICSCDDFDDFYACGHTLACSWWLQEQINRRGPARVMEFFSELAVDHVAAGRELVNELFAIVGEAKPASRRNKRHAAEETDGEQLQWRIAMSDARYYCPITIRAFLQRPKKSGRGWTKGREVRHSDLIRRDFAGHPVDGRIATVASTPSYSYDEHHFNEFRAIEMMIGHPNVAWDDDDADPIEVCSGELTIAIEPIVDPDDDESDPTLDDSKTMYAPRLELSGRPIDPATAKILMGYTSPAEPVVLVIESHLSRWTLCPMRDPKASKLIDFLLANDLTQLQLDAEAAGRFAVGSAAVDSMLKVRLPMRLAGPLEDVTAEMVVRLRPRPGAGLHIDVAVHDDRFADFMIPGQTPAVVVCLTDDGPLRLQRDLPSEHDRAKTLIDRFKFHDLSPTGAYAFTAETDHEALDVLGRLYAAGDDAPRLIWPEGESIKVRGEITPSSLKVQIDDQRDWFGLEGSVKIDGRDVPLADLLAAVRDRQSLVKVGDREFAQISDAFRQRLKQLSDTVVEDRGGLKIADAVVPAVAELIGNDVPIEATARWHDSIAKLESITDWQPQQPDSLDATLRDYQTDGYRWLARLSRWGVGGVLADDMGLGKTVQTLGVLIDRAADGPALIIAPTSVGENWSREAVKFAPELTPRSYRDADRAALVESAGPGDLVIVSYQLVQRDADLFASRKWATLVLDEAQFIKNSQTKTSQAIRRIDADWRIGLSGTPLENHLGELWSLFRTLSPGLLGSWERFRTRFAEPIERQKDDERRESLSRLVRPFILRRTKSKVLKELPPRTEITLQAELSPGERELYEQTRIAALAELSGDGGGAGAGADGGSKQGGAGQKRIKTLAWLTKLRQLACHPRLVDGGWSGGSAKMTLMMQTIDELRDGDHRALMFSQFVKHLSLVREELDRRGILYQYLDGATPAAERQKRVDAVQNGEGDLFLISLKAGGTGLNLTAADYVLHLDPWWNPAVEDQATDRAHRIGQSRAVTVYRLVASGTIEEKILQLHADKRELVSGVLDGTDKAAKLETADLIDLIREGSLS